MTDPSSPEHRRLDPVELAAWHGMLTAHAVVLRVLDRRLQAEHGLAVTEFDVLITLSNAPGQRLAMTGLAGAIMLSPAGVTHVVTRLERERLVERDPDPSDRRRVLVTLTAAGRTKLDGARATHDDVVRSRFTDRLTVEQRHALAAVWSAVLAPPPEPEAGLG